MSTPRPTMTPDPNRRNESRGYQLTTVAIVCPILPVILTTLRIYTRLILIKKRFWEDLSIVIALVRKSFPARSSYLHSLLLLWLRGGGCPTGVDNRCRCAPCSYQLPTTWVRTWERGTTCSCQHCYPVNGTQLTDGQPLYMAAGNISKPSLLLIWSRLPKYTSNPPCQSRTVLKQQQVGIALTQLYSLTHFFVKLSVLLQYARVSVLPSDKRLCRISIAVLCTGYLIFIVLRMVRCIPFHALWTHGVPGALCIYNNTWFMFASQGWNMIMDFVILLGPLYILRHSNAPLKQRVLLGVLLALGGSYVTPSPAHPPQHIPVPQCPPPSH